VECEANKSLIMEIC